MIPHYRLFVNPFQSFSSIVSQRDFFADEKQTKKQTKKPRLVLLTHRGFNNTQRSLYAFLHYFKYFFQARIKRLIRFILLFVQCHPFFVRNNAFLDFDYFFNGFFDRRIFARGNHCKYRRAVPGTLFHFGNHYFRAENVCDYLPPKLAFRAAAAKRCRTYL